MIYLFNLIKNYFEKKIKIIIGDWGLGIGPNPQLILFILN